MIGYVDNYLERSLIALLEAFVRKESTEKGRTGISAPSPVENMVTQEGTWLNTSRGDAVCKIQR